MAKEKVGRGRSKRKKERGEARVADRMLLARERWKKMDLYFLVRFLITKQESG